MSPGLARQLLEHARGGSIALRRDDASHLILGEPPHTAAAYDLRAPMVVTLILDALDVLASPGGTISVLGPSPIEPKTEVEVTLDQMALRRAMLD